MKRESKRTRSSQGPLLVVGGGILLIAVAVVLALQPGTASGTGPTPLPVDPDGVARVRLAEAKAAFDDGTAVFLDVRYADDYAAGHIPGAASIPLGELEGRLGEIDPDDWIITYCT
jgi:3-mercaptopyruvate sulfurtransferase SseA